jgi:hypothetical protein
MKFEIKNRFNGELIFEVETTSWKLAVELAIKAKADLRYADLSYADLRYANLSYANLRYADLSYADLRSADLRYADLRSADLRYAKGINKYRCTPLLMLLDQPGIIVAYKLVKVDGLAPFNGGITYQIGKDYEVKDANTDELEDCGKGINLATLDWCMKEWQESYRILKAEFTAKDIACIPTATDGKFRVFRCKITEEVNLKKIGTLKGEE